MRRMQAIFTNASAEQGWLIQTKVLFMIQRLGHTVQMRCRQRLIACVFQPNRLSAQLIRRPE